MHPIENWLKNGGGYSAGVELYLQFGTNSLLKQLFQEKYSTFKEGKLRQALAATIFHSNPPDLVQSGPASVGAPFVPDPAPQKAILKKLESQKEELEEQVEELTDQVVELEEQVEDLEEENKKLALARKNAPKGWPADMDKTVRLLHDQWLPLFSEKKNLQARIYDVALAGQQDPEKKKEAGAMAHRILDLRDQIRKIYSDRDQYVATGKLPVEIPKDMPLVPADPLKWPLTLQNWQRYIRDIKAKHAKQPKDSHLERIAFYQSGVAELKKLLKIE